MCDVLPGPHHGYVLAAAVESCGWLCDPKRHPGIGRLSRALALIEKHARGVNGRKAASLYKIMSAKNLNNIDIYISKILFHLAFKNEA